MKYANEVIICIRLWFAEMGGSILLPSRFGRHIQNFYFSINFKLSGLNHRKHMGAQEDTIEYTIENCFAARSDTVITLVFIVVDS